MSRFLPKRLDGIFPKKPHAGGEARYPLATSEEKDEESAQEELFKKEENKFDFHEIISEENPHDAEHEVIITDPFGASDATFSSLPPSSRWRFGLPWTRIKSFLRALSLFKKNSSEIVQESSSPLAMEIKEHRKLRLVGWGVAAGLGLVVIIAVVLSTVFAALTVFVKPHTDLVAIPETAVGLDSAVSQPNLGQRILPAERLEFTHHAEGSFQSSGKEHIEVGARGKVRLYNKFSSSPQSLVALTRFITDSGVIYRVPKAVTIPGAKIEEGKIVSQFIEAELVADKMGEGGNASGEIMLHIPGFKGSPKFDGFYAVASSGFSGGFKGEARVVTRDDLKPAQEKVSKQVYDELKNAALGKIPPQFKFLESLREVQITKVDFPQEKSRADEFKGSVDGVGRVIVFRESDLYNLLQEVLLKGDSIKEIVPAGSRVEYQVRSVDFEKGRATLSLKGNIKIKTKVPQGELVLLLKGKKEGSIIELLKGRPELESFRLTFFPFWLSRAPDSEDKIKLEILEP